MAELEISIAAGDPGPMITLSGEADITTVEQLSELVTAQLSAGTLHLTIDAAGLSYADSISVRVLMLAARTFKERGGAIVLLRPQQPVARLLGLLGADQVIMIRADAGVKPEMGSAAKDNPEQTRSAHDVRRPGDPKWLLLAAADTRAGPRAKRSPFGRGPRQAGRGSLEAAGTPVMHTGRPCWLNCCPPGNGSAVRG